MLKQDNLRKQVKLLKAIQGISYKEIAEILEIKQSSFYSWLNNYYDLGEEKETVLNYLVSNLREV